MARVAAEAVGLQTIHQVVDDFYRRVQDDPVLGTRFSVVTDWAAHKARIVHFWWVALGGAAYEPYRYRVVYTHRALEVRASEIQRWLDLFADCVQSALPESLAAVWLHRAKAMGGSLAQVVARV
ncbi:MAG: group III truncated hemoglobin [Acidihalobacter sp.]|uniref:group III truncated hemoglobin n=1 Tax=Acidihalobacter sp. TaxID=1872108 RepID=UPI00307E9FA7